MLTLIPNVLLLATLLTILVCRLGNSCRLKNKFSWHYVNKIILLCYKNVLSQINWDNILPIASNNEQTFNSLYQIIQSELEKHCQRKKGRVRQPQSSHGLLQTF